MAMNEDEIKGGAQAAAGKVDDEAGGLAGDASLQAEGKIDQAQCPSLVIAVVANQQRQPVRSLERGLGHGDAHGDARGMGALPQRHSTLPGPPTTPACILTHHPRPDPPRTYSRVAP